MIMTRIAAAILALLVLTGWTEEEALQRFSGGWQMDDETHGTSGALQIDAQQRTIVVSIYHDHIDAKFDRVQIVGESAIFHVGEQKVAVFSGPDESRVVVRIGTGYTFEFRRAK